jgi:putative DNA primase/helicase
MAAKEHEQTRFSIDGREINQIRYDLKFAPDKGTNVSESADLRFFKGRKEIAAFEGLTREELEKAVGPYNLAHMENGVGANKRGLPRDESGKQIGVIGKLEKENIAAGEFQTGELQAKLTKEKVSAPGLSQSDAATAQPGQAQPASLQEYDFLTQDEARTTPKQEARVFGFDVGNDRAAREAIERNNNELLAVPRDALTEAEASQAVKNDVALFRTIQDQAERHAAAIAIGHNAEGQAAYKAELSKQPEIKEEVDAAYGVEAERRAALDNQEVNSIEADVGQVREAESLDAEVRRNVARMWANVTNEKTSATAKEAQNEREAGGNQIQDDDIFSDRAEKHTYVPVVPKDVEDAYIRVGTKYHYSSKPDLQAFEDKGNKLETKSNSERVAGDLVKIAHARGWGDIKVRGTDEFKRQVWLEASIQGIGVTGYKPTEADRAALEKKQRETPSNAIERDDLTKTKPGPQKTASVDSGRPDREEIEARPTVSPLPEKTPSTTAALAGVLLEHGKAKFNFDKDEKDSYFVKYRDGKGEEKTVWGIDLERAVKESKAEVGQRIELENKGKKPVTVDATVRDHSGKVVGTAPKITHRNEWEVKADALRNESAKEAVRKHPELVSAYAMVRAAELVAEKNFPAKTDQEKFVSQTKETLARRIEKGNPLPDVKVKAIQADKTAERNKSAELDR